VASSAGLLHAASVIEAAITSDRAKIFFMGFNPPVYGQQKGLKREGQHAFSDRQRLELAIKITLGNQENANPL
jgi:hypothetical protein